MATLERAVLASAKVVLKNPKLKLAGILEWSTGEIKAQNENEVVVRVPDPGVNICVFKVDDKRVV
jgi:hypothetical protein